MSRTDIPSERATNFEARVREALQTLMGFRGDKLDRALTLRDMIESGLLTLRPGAQVGSGTVPLLPGDELSAGSTPYAPDLTPPPSPDLLTATPAISHVVLEVPPATYTQGHGHLRTIIYGVNPTPARPNPTFTDAVKVGEFEGTIWAMPSNPATIWHLWAKWESRDNVVSPDPTGGANGVVVTTAVDVAPLVAALTGPGKPFKVVQTAYTLADGTPVPAGVYASDAYMGSFVAGRGQIGLLAVDDARIANLSAAKLTAGSIAVGQYIQSTGYVAGSAGWRINGDGTAEFSGVVVRGTVYASAGLIGGITIASNAVRAGQTAYNTGSGFHLGSDGRLSLGNSSGNRLTWDGTNLNVVGGGTFSGALSAASGTFTGSLSAATGTFSGSLSAATGTFSGSLSAATGTFSGSMTASAVNAVNTINLAGQAVTIPVGAYSEGLTPAGAFAQTVSINSTGAPISISASLVISNNQDYISWSLRRNGFVIYQGPTIFNPNPLSVAFTVIDTPGAGAHTYQLAASMNSYNRALVLMELKR